MRAWLIKILVGKKPVIMNVTLKLDDTIKASQPKVLFHQASVDYSDRVKKGDKK